MSRFEGKNTIILIADECTYKLVQSVFNEFSGKKCDSYTRKSAKIKSIRRMYKFDDFFDALDCMAALKNQLLTPIECRLYALSGNCYIMMKTTCSQRAAADKIMLEFGRRLSCRIYPIIAERAALISADFYSDCAKIGS